MDIKFFRSYNIMFYDYVGYSVTEGLYSSPVEYLAFIQEGVISVQVSESNVEQSGHILFQVKFSEDRDLSSSNRALVEFAALFRHDYDMFKLNVVSLEACNTVPLPVGTYSFDIAIKTNRTDLVYGSVIVEVTENGKLDTSIVMNK